MRMRLYYFTNSNYGLKSIRERRLKISRIEELNDPFEFLGIDLSDPDIRVKVGQMKSRIAENRGLICLSKSWRSPLMWGHYASKHTGLCLGFDVASELVAQVKYSRRRLSKNSHIDEVLAQRLLTTKFSQWSYEKEYRLFVSLEESEEDLYYMNFSHDLSLKQVIVGPRSGVSRRELSLALGPLDESVSCFKARAAFREFKVVMNRDKSQWQ